MDNLEQIINDLSRTDLKNRADLASFKRKISRQYGIPLLSNMELLKAYHSLLKKGRVSKSPLIEELLKTRPIRSLSGIVNITVLTKPYTCPGKCLYCPAEKNIPKSYLSGEPAVERAKTLRYHPYQQVQKRIEMLRSEGHPTDKIELRIVGETWSHYPRKYQTWFIIKCFQAANEAKISNSKLQAPNKLKIQNTKLQTLKTAQKINERAKHRIIGLSVETRPDFINAREIKNLRQLGVTMVELGVQSIYDSVLEKNRRGHGSREIIEATRLLKDAGFKVLYQVMPNLAGSDLKKDQQMFEDLFIKDGFKPDLLKIYPCALVRQTPLFNLWQTGRYRPYSRHQLIKLIKEIKQIIPFYVRIQRISRDIPPRLVVKGPAKILNLRQIIKKTMAEEGKICRCIRCREVRSGYCRREKAYLFRQDYKASQGKEVFLSFENKSRTKLYSLLRLRLTADKQAIIREIHTYGLLLPINGCPTPINLAGTPINLAGQEKIAGATRVLAAQHQGLGKKLIAEAEKVTRLEFKAGEIKVIAGVGVRQYFRRLGYRLKNTYMVKRIR